MNVRIIGIDLAVTAKHKAAILDQASNKFVGPIHSFRANPAEIDRLLTQARANCPEDTPLVAVMEATGMAWYPVGVYLHQRGAQVHRVNGQKTRDLRRVFMRHVSSDRIDARILASLYQLAPDSMPHWQPATGDQLALQRGCREYDRWRVWRTAIENRVQAWDDWAWGGLHKVVPAAALPWMRSEWYDPWQVCAAGRDRLTQAWLAAAPKQPVDADWIPGWLARAQQMTILYGSPESVGYQELQASVRRQLTLAQQAQEAQRFLLKTVIEPLYWRLEPNGFLEGIPGIGLASAATYIAFIQDIQRFPTVEGFRRWTGMVPGSGQTGTFESKGLPLTKAGPNLVKAALYLNAQVARHYDVDIAAVYYRQMVHYGKHYHQAICACASHLASRIYVVLKERRPYQLRDLDGRPIDKRTARDLCRFHFHVPAEVRQRNSRRQRCHKTEARVEKQFQKRQTSA